MNSTTLVMGTIDINYLGVSHPFEELLVPGVTGMVRYVRLKGRCRITVIVN